MIGTLGFSIEMSLLTIPRDSPHSYWLVGFTFVISPQDFLNLPNPGIRHKRGNSRAARILKKPLFVLCIFEMKCRKTFMTLAQLDLLFPFFVFAYGVMICFVTSLPALLEKGEGKIPPFMLHRLKAHEPLGWVCFIVGGLWSLQNIWMMP